MSSCWFGSLQNRLAENASQPAPYVSMLATEICYSDRHPYEIVAVKDDRHISARALDYKVVKGNCQDGSAEYEYSSNEANSIIQLFKKKNGKWVQKIGRQECSNHFVLGYAEEYYDPSF